ncbi:acyltransferase [Pedobacter aquatilis]|uniref:acyltransferase family protein n=1 Tax=Pedobacter aquatilis TaxID=351343 RepID=UPI00292EE16C|nr:acyltransferase [Pedobacter aquatilis]
MKETKHFVFLDGLRGIAAIVVVIFHLFESIYQKQHVNLFAHGFLAVDFFFCLSGFVIAYAYDDRVGKLGYLPFIKRRLIRLHPLVILGSVLGLAIYLFDPWANYSISWNPVLIVTAYFQSNVLIPTTIPVSNRYGNLFPFNPPSWSLSLEYLANIIYILILVRLPRKGLILIFSCSLLVLIYLAHKFGTLSGGWHSETLIVGIARMSFSFLAGLIIKRYSIRIKDKANPIFVMILLLVALAMPYLKYNWLVEVFIVTVLFPTIIALAAGVQISNKLKYTADILGRLSYPLYITHYWFITILSNYCKIYQLNNVTALLVILTATCGLILLAYVALRFYDEPLRKWLNKKLVRYTN